MTIREGEIIRVVVNAVYERGVEIEHEGVPGYIQPVEISWIPRTKAPDVVRPGDEIDVFVCTVFPGRFSASIKRVRPDLNPWVDPSRYAVGARHEGVVVGLFDWCCTVDIAELVPGVVLAKRYPGDYAIGQKLHVEIELARLTMQFGMCDRGVVELRPLDPRTSRESNACDAVASTLRVNDVVRVVVAGVSPHGAVDVDYRGLRGTVESRETDWRWMTKPHGLRAGDEIDVRLRWITRNGLSASIKRVRPELDPFRDPARYAVGTRHTGIVTAVLGNGYALDVGELAEGLISTGRSPGALVVGQLVAVEVVRAENELLELQPV